MDRSAAQYQLKNLGRINVVLGKNGSVKSTLLKIVEQNLETEGEKRYVTPERGGTLTYEAGIDHNLTTDANWLRSSRRVNQFVQFRQQSMAQFRRLELAVLRGDEGKRVADFAPYVALLNTLLDTGSSPPPLPAWAKRWRSSSAASPLRSSRSCLTP